jgi:hypothetical protein
MKRAAFAVIACLLLISGTQVVTALPAHAATKPVTITFTKVVHLGDDIDPGITQGPVGDFYAAATINGGPRQHTFADRFDYGFEIGVGYIFPFTLTPPDSWTITQEVDDSATSVPVSLELWDNDDCDTPFCTDTGIFESDDDQVDISPTGSETLNFNVDLADGTWSGDVNFPQNCATGTGGEAATLCWDINTISSSGDTDGDRLLDAWEQHGINGDGDGTIDVDLPAFGANPNRKDLFLEIDCLTDDGNGDGDLIDTIDHSHCPLATALTPVVQGFANAPVANVDGTTGIQLHLDTGTLLANATVNGTGGVTGTIGNLGGGGTQINENGNEVMDWDGSTGNPGTDLHTLKQANFDAARRAPVFRYVIFGHQTNQRQAQNDCTSGVAEDIPGNDFMVTLGGFRDLDGNGTADTTCWGSTPADTIDNDGDGTADEDPADGIDNDGDCVAGTDTDGDGSPCSGGDVGVDEDGGHSLGSSSTQAGTLMHEFGHVLGLQHGGSDGLNDKPNYLSVMNYSFQSCSVPASPAGATAPIPGGCDYSRSTVNLDENSLDECFGVGPQLGFGPNDWNGAGGLQGVTNCQPPNTTNVPFDISGDNTRTNLPGFDDWSNVFFDFRGLDNYGDDGAINPVADEPDPETLEDTKDHLHELVEPDVHVTLDGPVAALPGQVLTFDIEAVNDGRGPALDTALVSTRPDGSTQSSALGALLVNGTANRSVQFTVPTNACPQTLTTSAKVTYESFAGVSGSATGSFATQVQDITPPTLTVKLSPNSLWPPNHKMKDVTATIVAKDECDPNPQVRLLSIVSNEPDNGLGDGDTAGDVGGAATGTDDRSFQVRAERSGRGNGRIYTVTYEARDVSGNATVRTATVTVAH